ncbi:TetR/AcrR family transcriptional regulator [[Mycobacterium] burgundiense]|jgi:AcrR family transcriptional regulator|uniref:TetR/AcrR family transcriptional regulator n=1 Tax=[Mycobacterium] burgundiense TaxID=3064286 RepID=A0ABM9LHQ6_9MYCO|nr:TetR/AcrR family transcriptional regulator [Mycolicibacterium sp. MU0053]CAJ1499210.1 TetR/AcrR family transcriptional regulator [Mycolicibacterium sp. MU0053]
MARRPAKPAVASDTADAKKSELTRIRILDATARVLSEKGYAGTRLTDVAAYAELQAPAIYYYFSSRDDLIEEVMFAGISDMRRHLQAELDRLPDGVSPMDRIVFAVETHLRHELELSDYTTASIRNSGQIPEHLRSRQKKEAAAYNRIWRKLFSAARAEGQLREDLDEQLAQALVLGALNWTAEWWDPRRGSLDTIVANAQVFVRHSLAPHPARANNAAGTSKGKARAAKR